METEHTFLSTGTRVQNVINGTRHFLFTLVSSFNAIGREPLIYYMERHGFYF